MKWRKPVMPRFLDVAVSRKFDGSLLTEADLAAQAAFACGLPENHCLPHARRRNERTRQRHLWQYNEEGLWVVDPIDGTNNFISGLPHFALSAALIAPRPRPIGRGVQPGER